MMPPIFWRTDGLVPRLLSPVSTIWTLTGRLRRAGTSAYTAGVPLICVGNATVGGAGKTPVVQALVTDLIELGHRPGILSRGYKSRLAGPIQVDPTLHNATQVGDEPLLHATLAPTVISRRRVEGARLLETQGVDVIVMDDGLQNPTLAPSTSLLVIDGAAGFGNRRVMPAGPLREPLADVLGRTSAIALIGEDRTGVRDLIPRGLPIFRARIEPLAEAERFRGRRVLVFAGIGRPGKISETLNDLGAEVIELVAFPDHHAYRPDEVMALVERARALDAIPVTTTKDHVRLPAEARPMVRALPVRLVWREPDLVSAWLSAGLE